MVGHKDTCECYLPHKEHKGLKFNFCFPLKEKNSRYWGIYIISEQSMLVYIFHEYFWKLKKVKPCHEHFILWSTIAYTV